MRNFTLLSINLFLLFFTAACSVEELEAPNSPAKNNFLREDAAGVKNTLDWTYSNSQTGFDQTSLTLHTSSYPISSNGSGFNLRTQQYGDDADKDFLNFSWGGIGRIYSGQTYDLLNYNFSLQVQRDGVFQQIYSSDSRLREASIYFTTMDYVNEEIKGRLEIAYSDGAYITHELDFEITDAPRGYNVID